MHITVAMGCSREWRAYIRGDTMDYVDLRNRRIVELGMNDDDVDWLGIILICALAAMVITPSLVTIWRTSL